MLITEEQIKNGYPLEAVRFFNTFDEYLSDEVDEYGIKKCKPDSFNVFAEVGADVPKRLLSEYEANLRLVHEYLDKGYNL